jgi:uncharacterized protein (TIGR03663 family)
VAELTQPRPRSRRRFRAALADRPRGELIAWGVLFAIGVALRLIDLGSRPFHHDESQDAYFSWLFQTTGDYAYNPLLHGPLRFYLTAANFVLFGDSDFTARLAPALMGALMIPLLYGLRRQLGRVAAFAAAALLAVGPSFLYFSRFAREDIYIAAITLAMLVVAFRFFDRPRRAHPAMFGALLAASFGTKETTFITVFVAGTFFLVAIAWQTRAAGDWREGAIVRALRQPRWDDWAWGVVATLGVYTAIFTTFLTHPSGIYGLWTGLDYWLGQHSVGRGGEPPGFYSVVLFGEEWPVLLLGAVGAFATFKRPTLLRLFLIWAFVVSLAVYSWAGEKFAWLVLHPLLPLVLLAGVGVQAIWEARRAWYGKAAAAVAVVALSYTVYASYLVNAVHGADPRELLVSTQSSTDVKQVADEVLALAKRRGKLKVTIDSAEGATFPYAWYFRHLDVGYIDLSQAGSPPPESDVILLTQASNTRLSPTLTGYDGRKYRFRVWWVRDYGAMSPGNWARWMLERKPWNPTGGMPEWIYVRRVAAAEAG